MQHEDIIDAYFAAMRRGPAAERDLVALFDDDAVYDEPFVSPGRPAVGKQEISDRLLTGWQNPPPDMELDVLRVQVDGNSAVVAWECRSPVFPEPVRGHDRYRFTDGLIAELTVTLDRDAADP